jgi:hypothetical protein
VILKKNKKKLSEELYYKIITNMKIRVRVYTTWHYIGMIFFHEIHENDIIEECKEWINLCLKSEYVLYGVYTRIGKYLNIKPYAIDKKESYKYGFKDTICIKFKIENIREDSWKDWFCDDDGYFQGEIGKILE